MLSSSELWAALENSPFLANKGRICYKLMDFCHIFQRSWEWIYEKEVIKVKRFLKKLSSPFVLLFLEARFVQPLRNQTLEFKTFPPVVTSLLFFILLILAVNLKTSPRQISKILIILKKKSSVGKFRQWTNMSTNMRECCL